MKAEINPWESGSEFQWLQLRKRSGKSAYQPEMRLYSCGRTALAGLIKYGMDFLGWRRLWIPCYYCPEVVASIRATGIKTNFYHDSPADAVEVPTDVSADDAILIVNYFGRKSRSDYAGVYALGIAVIEDHSHDPWSRWAIQSTAGHLVASYRKTLPVPDGGVLWSNVGAPLPPQPKANKKAGSGVPEKIEAMLMKAMYFDGIIAEKEGYLDLFNQAKQNLAEQTTQKDGGGEAISEISQAILNSFPWHNWRERRRTNYRHLRQQIPEWSDVKILEAQSRESYPFMLTLLFSARNKRDIVRKHLIENSVYPAVIWPLDEINEPWADEWARTLSGRILSIHCDGRYSLADMDKIAAILIRCLAS